MRARRVEIFVLATIGVYTIKAADDEVIDHVNHGFGNTIIKTFKCVHAFLDQHLVDFHALLHDGHFVALLAI